MDNCYEGTNVPNLIDEPCKGKYTSDNCIVHPESVTYLSIAPNTSINEILKKVVLALQYKDQQIANLQSQIDNLI